MKNVVSVREKLRASNPNCRIIALIDNMLYVDESRCDVIRWDDENEIVYILKTNEDHRDPSRPFKIQAIEYEWIIGLEMTTDKNGIKAPAEACGLDPDKVESLVQNLSTIKLQ